MEQDAKFPQILTAALNPMEDKHAMLAAIIASTDDTIISKTLDGTITSWNPAAERMFGYTEAEAVGKHITLIIPPERFTEEAFIIGQIAKGENVDNFETIRRKKNGDLIPISLTVSPIKNNKGQIIGASKIARDVTERKKDDEKKAVLAAIVASTDDAIISKTLDGVITIWNKAAERMFGYTEDEAIGQHISLIIPSDRLQEETFIIGEITKGRKVDHFQTFHRAKNNSLVPISLSISPVIDSNGKIIGASKIARDISAEQAALKETADLYIQLKELNAKKDEFIALASHELKTPLTSIAGYLQILSQRITDEKNIMFVKKTQQQVSKLSALVSDLLDVSKIEAGKLNFALDNFNIREVVDDVVDLITHSNNRYEIVLKTSVSELFIKGDAHRIEQVIINLLTNAIRYAPDSKRIEVYLIDETNGIKIGVKDFGKGIPQDKLNDIFSRFYRVDESDNKASGLGIGLYLCYEIVNRHHGKIWAESTPNVGSTFWFTLPF